jgi:ribosomal protein S18 acetylase RimI-like enzyme
MTMEKLKANAVISSDSSMLQTDRILELLKQSYWANTRPLEVVLRAIESSVCYGVYEDGLQVGFARVITDFATTFYLCDVIIDKACRGKGYGKQLLQAIVDDERFRPLLGILLTSDAHGLYEKYGFVKDGEKSMTKPRI